MSNRSYGWYWCKLKHQIENDGEAAELHIFEWCNSGGGADYWQVYDMAYDDDQVVVIEGPIPEPKMQAGEL